jgi:23S rRNA (cytidine1920-2'-O)/16S rRNA (cytidine1409-2'-O)-methyltransferase
LADTGRIVALVKPQFEAGKEDVPRGGVVRDPAVWLRVLANLATDAEAAGLSTHRVIRSPIEGGDGNVEYLADIRRGEARDPAYDESVAMAVTDGGTSAG